VRREETTPIEYRNREIPAGSAFEYGDILRNLRDRRADLRKSLGSGADDREIAFRALREEFHVADRTRGANADHQP
jgi:hypothetical protein